METHWKGTAKIGVFRVLAILQYMKENTEPGKIFYKVDVERWLKSNYDSNIGRNTVENILDVMYKSGLVDGMKYELKCEGGTDKGYKYDGLFSTEQVSLLADLVASSMFLDQSTADNLIEKIGQLCNLDTRKTLPKSDHFIRPPMMNPEALKNIQKINEAIRLKCKIQYYPARFNRYSALCYFKEDAAHNIRHVIIDKNGNITEKPYERREGYNYTPHKISPYKMVWDNAKCYLICGEDVDGKIVPRCYRVDRMAEVSLVKGKNKDLEKINKSNPFYLSGGEGDMDIKGYYRSMFMMFASDGNKAENVKFRVKNSKRKVILERFGESADCQMQAKNDEYFTCTVKIQVTDQFLGWLSCFSADEIRILGPEAVVERYRTFLKTRAEEYADPPKE